MVEINKILILIIICIVGIGCLAQEKDFAQIIKNTTSIDVSKKYLEIQFEANAAIGDYSESFFLKFDSINFMTIKIQVINSPYYTNINIESPQINVKTQKGDKKWYKKTDGYKFEYNINGYREFVECYIDTIQRTIFYHHIQE
jgi:hypothetical protein